MLLWLVYSNVLKILAHNTIKAAANAIKRATGNTILINSPDAHNQYLFIQLARNNKQLSRVNN